MFTPVENRLGVQPIAFGNTFTGLLQSGQSPFFNKEHPLGTIVRAYDPVYGEGEFIYLQMAAGQAPGHLVTWGGYGTVITDGTGYEAQFAAALTTNTTYQDRAVAVAMSGWPVAYQGAAPVTAFGWFQISGNAVVFTNGTATGSPAKIYQSATSGLVTSTQANGLQILNAQLLANQGAATLVAPANFVNVASGTVVAGGTGYTTGQTVNLVGGTGLSAQAQFTVTASGGVVSAVAVYAPGAYSALPATTLTTAGGTAYGQGSGLTVTVTSQSPYAVAYINRPALQGQIT